jgi:uncharacterized UBP type Zn finger protein
LAAALLLLRSSSVALFTRDYVSRMASNPYCSHIDTIDRVPPTSRVCDECVALGDTWVHLRACLSCGHVGCCDASKNKHATKHYHRSQHPLIQTIEPGEDWIYCYVDDVAMDP